MRGGVAPVSTSLRAVDTARLRSRTRTPSALRVSRRPTECCGAQSENSTHRLRVRVCTAAGCSPLVLDEADTVRNMLLQGGVPCGEAGHVGAFVNGEWRMLPTSSTLVGLHIEDNTVVSVFIPDTPRTVSSPLLRFWEKHAGALFIAAGIFTIAAAIAQSPLLSLHPPSAGAAAGPALRSLFDVLKLQKWMLPVIGVAAAWLGLALSSPFARVAVSIAGVLVRSHVAPQLAPACAPARFSQPDSTHQLYFL